MNKFVRKDCFAYRNDTEQGCVALKCRNCVKCSFYKQDEEKQDCFAYVGKDVCSGCKILKERNCKNCSFYKTEEQKNEDLKKAFEKITLLPDYIRSDIKYLYEECELKESDVGGVLV